MATREKKLSIGRKQNTPIPSAKEEIAVSELNNKNEEDNQIVNKVSTPTKGVSSVKKLINKTVPKKLKKKAIVNVKLKPTLKVKTTKLKQRMITSMLKSSNNVNAKKNLVKNPVSSGRPKKAKLCNKIEDNLVQPLSDLGLPKDDEPDKQIKKKNLKTFPKSVNISKKTNNENLTAEQSTVKKTYKRKLKVVDNETTEDVMNDLSALLANSDVKIEVKEEPIEVTAAETFKSDLVRPKKIVRRKKKIDVENTLSILSPSDRKVIDRLDLNVNKMEDLPLAKRRHSIEKFPVGVIDSDSNSTNKLSFMNNLSECNIPRSRNSPRLRQSADRLCGRSNPYKTRSEGRTLRSGKGRKLNLLEGIRASRRRRRNYSEYSGSEKSFPKSEYESDSSISDLSSLHGAEQNDKDTENIKPEIIESCDESVVKNDKPKIRKSRSHESNNFTDTNSNLYVKENKASSKNEDFLLQLTGVGPSLELPQKSMILDIMKQTFNVIFDAKDVKYLKSQAAKQNAQLTNSASENGQSETDLETNELKLERCKVEEKINEIQDMVKVEEESDNNEQEQNKLEVDLDNIKEEATNNCEQENSSEIIEGEKTQDTELAQISDIINPETVSEKSLFTDSDSVNETSDKLNSMGGNLNDSVNSETDDVRKAIDEVYSTDLGEEKQEEEVTVEDINNESQVLEEEVVEPKKDTEQLQNGVSDLPADYETPENLTIKENILQALGLQSNKAAKEANLKNKEKSDVKSDIYTGSLKTVIKISRLEKKRGRNLKMGLHKNRKSADIEPSGGEPNTEAASTSSKQSGGQSSDSAGAQRKSHYSNRSNLDGSSDHVPDLENGHKDKEKLVVPEKASSFKVHPERVCKDECSYCFGKFGMYDTPLHIAQIKHIERQNRILATEKHLTHDSCLCDACYRHVDRKANTPSYTNKSVKRSNMIAPGPRQDHCHVLGCGKMAVNILRRKWLIKMRKSISEVINIDFDNQGLHSIPICDEHYSALEHLMVCAMCKRRLAKNHILYLGAESADLNKALDNEGLPLTLINKAVVCKLCKYFATIILTNCDERDENTMNFFNGYKKRLLHFNNIVPMDAASAEQPIIIPSRDSKIEKDQPVRKKRKLMKQPLISQEGDYDSQVEIDKSDQSHVPSSDSTNQSRPESPVDYLIDYETLVPSIAMDCSSDSDSKKENSIEPTQPKQITRPETVKEAVEQSKNMKLNNDNNMATIQRLGSNASLSVRQVFPNEDSLPLHAELKIGTKDEHISDGWLKCTSTIQYDPAIKDLWIKLQEPYGNQSSFLKHLILLENYFRNGDLVLSPNASHHSISYHNAVHNRLRAFDNIPSKVEAAKPAISITPSNKQQKSIYETPATATTSNSNKQNLLPILNAAKIPKSTPIKISQLKSCSSLQSLPSASPIQKSKTVSAPPDLISLQPGTKKPVFLVKSTKSHKFKFPIPRDWRPNLIPSETYDPKHAIHELGFVQVVSGGKSYYITNEDYHKMCAIKRSFELRQLRLSQGVSMSRTPPQKTANSVLKTVSSSSPRKGLVISKTSTSPKNNNELSPENILEKLDKQMETRMVENKSLSLPKIPKSLTVIPQTVARKPSRPSSPVLMITSKPKQVKKS